MKNRYILTDIHNKVYYKDELIYLELIDNAFIIGNGKILTQYVLLNLII